MLHPTSLADAVRTLSLAFAVGGLAASSTVAPTDPAPPAEPAARAAKDPADPAAVAATADTALPQDTVAGVGDAYVLAFDEDGTSLVDLLELCQTLIDVPVHYDAAEVADVRVRIMGPMAVKRDRMRSFLDEVLRKHGFLSWDAPPGEAPSVTVSRMRDGTRRRPGRVEPNQTVALADLQRPPARITATYTTVFPLSHIDARSAMATFAPFFDHATDMVRSVERSNTLVATSTSIQRLREMRELIALVDVPATGGPRHPLEQRIEALERRIQELEASDGEDGDG